MIVRNSKANLYASDAGETNVIPNGSRILTPNNINIKRLSVALSLGIFCFIVAVVMMVIDPVLIIAKYNTRVTNGSLVHKILEKEIESIHVSAYLFNVTNADRFMAGDDHNLKVEEIGPFTYRELRSNRDLEIDEESGVIRYSPHINVTFLPEESIGRPEEINVTVPNIAMLSMTSMITEYPYLTKMGYNFLAGQYSSKALVNMDAHNYLWGYDEPLVRLGNRFFPSWINFDIMGLMDRLYDKKNHFRLEVGGLDKDKFEIKTMNGYKGLNVRDYEDLDKRSACNTFMNAYEGIGYPAEMTPGRPVRIYRNVLCRMLELDFIEQKTMDYGAEALVYKISNRTFGVNNDTECLCGQQECVQGMSDLSACFYGLPLSISNAHFMDAHPKLFERIEGLKPDEEKHGSHFLIEPKIGMALATKFSIQVNIVVGDVSFNSEAHKFSNMVIPVGYFKIVQPELIQESKDQLKLMYITGPRIILSLVIILFIVGLMFFAYSAQLLYWNWFYSDNRGIAFHVPTEEKMATILSVELPLISSFES